MTAKSFTFTKIVVADLDAAERFYIQALGLARVAYIEFGSGVGHLQEVVLGVPGAVPTAANLQLIHFPNRPQPLAGETVIGFTVDDVARTVDTLVAAGARVTVPVMELPHDRLKLAFVTDLDGHIIEILEML